MNEHPNEIHHDLLSSVSREYGTVLADPPWQFTNRTGKMAPEHRRLNRYGTLHLDDICNLPVEDLLAPTAHLYLWVPNALLADGLAVMQAWGFIYKSNLVWYKVRRDGGPDRRGVGFYFRNVTELVLFGVRNKNARTLQPGRTQPNIMVSQKREHSRKPDEIFDVVTSCSPGPFLEMFARERHDGWDAWGNQVDTYDAENSSAAGHRGYVNGGQRRSTVTTTGTPPLFPGNGFVSLNAVEPH